MTENSSSSGVELLHPYYLDTDMSMAFAAALSGGVALEREMHESGHTESDAVRNIQGNIRAFSALGLGGSRDTREGEKASVESRLVRQHSEASVFISLYNELRDQGRLLTDPSADLPQVGQLVAFEIGPAVAPLRRILDQILRLFDVISTTVEDEEPKQNRQQRRHPELHQGNSESEGNSVEGFTQIFRALKDDLDQSGMVDIAVIPASDMSEDQDPGSTPASQVPQEPSILLTLDKRFLSEQALELLHTSRFTVVGKVTQTWATPDEIVNLYRRSVMALLPALSQTVTWGIMGLLGGMASGLDTSDMKRMAFNSIGAEVEEEEDQSGEILIGTEAIEAMSAAVLSGPAIQILPLAICA